MSAILSTGIWVTQDLKHIASFGDDDLTVSYIELVDKNESQIYMFLIK